MHQIFPGELTWENIEKKYIDLSEYKHPDWVKAHFPLVMIYYKPKAGKLRESKNWKVMYQNNNNVMTQLVWTAEEFGMFNRKNSHKGYNMIVGAIQGTEEDLNMFHTEMQKPEKYKNFQELKLHDADNKQFHIMCDVLGENYPCDSTGQIRLL